MENTTKDTSYDYGREYQLRQKAKYLNRDNNHWKIKNNLIFDLVEKSLDGNNKENKDINIVDVGCSIGTFAIEFAKKEYSTFGVDFDSTALEIARELAEEEGVQTEFICDDIANFSNTERSLDIAVCADIFEHLHDDELGSMLVSIRKSLSEGGSLVFYTYPTEYDYIFYGKRILHYPLIPFKWLSEKSFSKVVRVYAKLLDIGLLLFKNKDRKEWIKKQFHCNPLTKDRLKDILERAGYEIKLLDVENLYDYHNDIQGKFKKHEYLYRNIYGIASPKV